VKDYTNAHIVSLPGSIAVISKNVVVAARFPAVAGVVQTLEGPVAHAAGDAILTGSKGEEWPVARERFMARYLPCEGTATGDDGVYRKRPASAHAFHSPEAFRVRGGSGDFLHGQSGDWLLQYDDGEYGVVAADIFHDLYERPSG
jgi:hypothetical protein